MTAACYDCQGAGMFLILNFCLFVSFRVFLGKKENLGEGKGVCDCDRGSVHPQL